LRAWENDAGWLVALQREFRRLYTEMMKTTTEVKCNTTGVNGAVREEDLEILSVYAGLPKPVGEHR